MKILLVTRAEGRVQSKKVIVADWLRVGRNASCEIHLPDPRVPLAQGMITHPDQGFLYVEGEAGSQSISRTAVRQVRMEVGVPIDIGPYRLERKTAPEGFDGQFDLDLASPPEAAAGLASRATQLTLGSLGLTKRWAAWLWALVVLGAFLVLPAGRVLDLPWSQAAQSSAFGDRFWNPGPLMLAHQPVEPKCSACHEVAFQHVKDRACLECHARIGQHVAPEMSPAALFEGARCTTCHREHKGVKSTHRDDDAFCVACHRDLRSRAKAAAAVNVSDFAADHPAFRLSLPTDGGVRRQRQGDGVLVEASNLVFPHATHLDPAGVRSPVQGRMKLECRSCHEPDAARKGFLPISMPKHCQECHTLQFEPAVTAREVPHGKPAEAQVVIEEFYASLALQGVRDSFQKAFGVPGEGLLRRVGEPSPAERESALRLAQRKAKQVAGEMFEVRVCKACHAITRERDDWRVAPVRATAEWMPQARFNHKSHAHAKCADCHDVASSRKAGDVAMPGIKACRECHGGSRPVEGKVTSNCLLCHGFHDSRHPWDPQFTPKPVDRAAGKVSDAK